jgi:hypothetical protein
MEQIFGQVGEGFGFWVLGVGFISTRFFPEYGLNQDAA